MAERVAEPEPLVIEEVHGWSLVQVAGWRGSASVEEDIAQVCGHAPPSDVGGVATATAVTLIRIGPDRVWIVDDVGDVAVRMVSTIDPRKGCVTALSEGRRRFRMSGNSVLDVLQSLIALDLASPSFGAGRAALTAVHRVPVLLHRISSRVFDLYVPTTFSTSLGEWIDKAAPKSRWLRD